MESTVRIINFIMEAVYLPIHLIFIIKLLRHRQPSPVYTWFVPVVLGLWGIVAEGLFESLFFLFWRNNFAFAIVKDYQLISTTLATMSFLMFNLYLSGKDELADKRSFRTLLFGLSGVVCAIFCTNPLHHLFYEKLEVGGDVTHGKLFMPCVVIVYGMLFAGLLISIVDIVKHGDHKVMRVLVFSMYPILPGTFNLIRSLTRFDTFDSNPIVMSVSLVCLYDIVFRKGYVSMLAQSFENILNQTKHGILIKGTSGDIIYANSTAKALQSLPEEEIESRFRTLSQPLENGLTQVTITDLTEIKQQQELLNKQIKNANLLSVSLTEKKTNIDAYLEALYEIPQLKEKQQLVSQTQEEIEKAFRCFKRNLSWALQTASQPGETGALSANEALSDNIEIAEATIAKVRSTVTRLKEGV